MSSLPTAYSLNPKTPAEVNRFAPVNSIQINKGSTPTLQVQLISRSALATPAQSDTESAGNLTHPEGSLIFHHDVVVSTQKITERHSALGVHILSQCGDSVADVPVTVFVEISEHDYQADYYVVLHRSKTIVWTVDQAPESFKGATQAKHEHEYWIHMENFPGPYFSTPEDLRSLKHVLGSNAIDALTSEGSTSPMSVEQIKTHLRMLDSFSGEGDVYQTYAIARLWNLILQSRVINKYGTPAARLDRFISISDNPPTFGGTYATMAKLMFNRPCIHLGRCSRAWADRIAYTEEWRKFRSTNEIEWQQVLYLSCVLVIASVILGKRSSCLFGIPAHAALLTSLASASSAYYLLTESQNLGDHAADASVYFQEREEILYGVQRIAVINATPQALLAWAFVLFVFSVFCI